MDDEEDLVTTLEYNLQSEGFTTRTALTGDGALAMLAEDPLPDLVLLDMMLPDISGTEICRRMRTKPRTAKMPVLILSARGEEIDRVVGFEVGADDYVVKPFSVRELSLRIRAIIKRSQNAPTPNEEITFGAIRLDPEGHRTFVGSAEIVLTAMEFRLLQTFLGRRGRVQTRDILLNDVWGIDADITTRTVDTHVKRLRQKLGRAGQYIETIRGVGYKLRAQPDERI